MIRHTALPINDGKGLALPDAASIVNGRFSLAERFYLYVHPDASGAALDLVRVISTPGAADEGFGSQGFISLAVKPRPTTASSPATSHDLDQ